MNVAVSLLCGVLMMFQILQCSSSKRVPRQDGDVMLIGGSGEHEGTVLVYHERRWGSICDFEWDLLDATVVCTQLGYPGAREAVHASKFGRGRRRMWMSDMHCRGYEKELQACMYPGWSRIIGKCRRGSRSAGVICKTEEDVTTTPVSEVRTDPPILKNDLDNIDGMLADDPNVLVHPKLDIRMAGGRYDWEGRLEVREGPTGDWGTICGDKWTLRETMVACRQMRGDHGKQALQVNYFGGETMNKIFYQIKCTGREANLDECLKVRTEDGGQCSKTILVAGVVCSTDLPDLTPDLQVLENSLLLHDRHLYYLTCSMEENCLSSSAYVLRNTSKSWRSATRRLLKFSSVIHNIGTADFRPFRSKTQWEWHSCHQHYHSMEVFAHYDLINLSGETLAEGSKASFCLEDSTCYHGTPPRYNCIGFRDQGLSVNCSDDYLNDIDCQWLDITDIKPGDFTFKLAVNPTMLVSELNFDNNVAACDLWYSGYSARITNCRYESLLKDRIEDIDGDETQALPLQDPVP